MAVIETLIICPLERLKVWMMTSEKKIKIRHYFNINIKSLFSGLLPVFTKQIVSWVTFLASQEYLKDLVYIKFKGNDRSIDFTVK